MSTHKCTLDGITAKLDRAQENISNIETEIALILGPDRHRFVTKENHDAVKQFLDEHLARPVPPRLSVLAAECIHNLRSCLDQLAWQLVLANGGKPDDTRFPLLLSDPNAISDPVKKQKAIAGYEGCVKGMSATAKAFILALQPYQPGNGGRDHLLRIVHDLNITDKHHELVIVKNSVRAEHGVTLSAASAGFHTLTLGATEDGAPTFQSATLRPVNVQHSVSIQIAFGSFGASRLVPVPEGLWRLRGAVERTVKRLTAEFTE